MEYGAGPMGLQYGAGPMGLQYGAGPMWFAVWGRANVVCSMGQGQCGLQYCELCTDKLCYSEGAFHEKPFCMCVASAINLRSSLVCRRVNLHVGIANQFIPTNERTANAEMTTIDIAMRATCNVVARQHAARVTYTLVGACHTISNFYVLCRQDREQFLCTPPS